MATRKPRKFNEGGMSDEDVKSFAGTSDNDSNAGMAGTTETASAAPAKTMSFKEAFAAARGTGDKTFEWNGKKYTTEMAKPKAAAPAEAPAKPKYQSLQDRAKSYEDARAKSGVGMYGTTKSAPKEERKALPLKSTKAEKNAFMGSTGLKKGGSVKGWGQARGARKAKMY